jgi:hypothetical protein
VDTCPDASASNLSNTSLNDLRSTVAIDVGFSIWFLDLAIFINRKFAWTKCSRVELDQALPHRPRTAAHGLTTITLPLAAKQPSALLLRAHAKSFAS